jgi:excisionase family DNA binding protein
LAHRLGVSRQWVYRWIQEKRIPSYRLFGAILLKEEDIKALLEQYQIPLERDKQ